MSGIDQLLKLARAYAQAEDLELSTVSWRVFGDTKKLTALIEDNADIQVRRYERALVWFSLHWPDGANWPSEIARPASSCAESA